MLGSRTPFGGADPSGVSERLPPETEVILTNLSRADLNGQPGIILGFDGSSGRYMVRLDVGNDIKVKPENVVPLADNDEDYDEDYDEMGESSGDD